jgi:hypothetical protein
MSHIKNRIYPEESNAPFFRNRTEISLLTPKGVEVEDMYPNQPEFSPKNWIKKLISYSGNVEEKEYNVIDAFQPTYNKDACQKLTALKKKSCKQKYRQSCIGETDKDTLRNRHNEFMMCRNIRALETNSHCKATNGMYSNQEPWFNPDDYGHLIEINHMGNDAATCVDEFVANFPSETPTGYIPPDQRTPVYRNYRSPIKPAHVTLSVSEDDDPPVRVMIKYKEQRAPRVSGKKKKNCKTRKSKKVRKCRKYVLNSSIKNLILL